MDFNTQNLILFSAVVTTAMSAGLFYGWTVSVIPGTLKIADLNYVETMQAINKEILNPGFFLSFLGAAACLLLATILQFKSGIDARFYLTIAALAIYLIGTLGITMFGNVPLNNGLELVRLTNATTEEILNARQVYEASWNTFNSIRTGASFVSFILILLVLFFK